MTTPSQVDLANPARRLLIGALAMAPAVVSLPALAKGRECGPASDWREWQAYLQHFVQPDGRVLDASTAKQHSSSESQSYGMFFALVANDQDAFDRIWRWSVDNLANGDIGRNLPAWIWGRDEDGNWQVLDSNSASDADIWFVYALAEAARVWQRPEYLLEARALLAQVEAQEIADLPGLGKMMLPGFRDFVLPDAIWQLNPSYLPLPVLRRLAELSPNGPWSEIADNTVRMLRAVSPRGYVADWVAYQGTDDDAGQFIIDPRKGETGSYDAIRNYLWAGLTSPKDPLARSVTRLLHGMADSTPVLQAPPEKVNVLSGVTENTGPFGFSSALVPYFEARGEKELAAAQARRASELWQASLDAATTAGQPQPPYYDHMLHLFSTGWQQGRYRFEPDGRIQLLWEQACPHVSTR